MDIVSEAIISAEEILSRLLAATPTRTSLAPSDQRGIYGLVDHRGDLRYIGSTASTSQTFYERIHRRHRTGSEDSSHYFSRMYNSGRMWRKRNDPSTQADGKIAKALRNAFIAENCRAVWVPLPDTADIAGLERAVIALAPAEAIAWNRRATEAYEEPEDLVDAMIMRLDLDRSQMAALERQRQRYHQSLMVPTTPTVRTSASKIVTPFPKGPFRFFALDVETANHDRSSICQIGVACVHPDNRIETWATYVDPEVDHWAFTYLHKINAKTVHGAPTFGDVLPMLSAALEGATVYQHSSFDRTAISAACKAHGLSNPDWNWRDSVQVARQAWPLLRGNGGHGLASLKAHLNLSFEHHDAGEDARAAAEVVLHAEANRPITVETQNQSIDAFDVVEAFEAPMQVVPVPAAPLNEGLNYTSPKVIGQATLTEGNIKNSHFYLRNFLHAFPKDSIGGSNADMSAPQSLSIDWGGNCLALTDIDGEKKLFRKRSWVREFFARTRAAAGDTICVERIESYAYRVSLRRG